VRKLKTEKGRVYVGCLRTGCAFVVRAKPDKNGQWVVTDSGVEHSCDAEGATRKRQLSSSILKKLAPDVEAVAVVRGSAAATVQNIVAGATGVQLKRTQATAIAKGNRSDPIATAVNEFQFVGAFIEKLRADDEVGTYLFQSVDSPDGLTFFAHVLGAERREEVLAGQRAPRRRRRHDLSDGPAQRLLFCRGDQRCGE
jgi:hypothetical protein